MSDELPRKRPSGLGRGLSALLGEVEREAPVSGGVRNGLAMVPVADIDPNPDQPRRRFDGDALDELAGSIAARGLIQPIVVRPMGRRFQIVAGERRWRAAQRARLHEIPVVVRELDDAATLEIAIVENIQRQELNPIEEAEGYRRLISEFGHRQESLAQLVHKSRSHVANLMRLLELPELVRTMVAEGMLTMGHARALVTAEDPEALAIEAEARGLSVRETEALARSRRAGAEVPGTTRRVSSGGGGAADSDVVELERQLGDLLGLKVKLAYGAAGGSVTLHFSTLDQLDMICQRLTGEPI